MKREKRLTKRERKALDPAPRPANVAKDRHIHCIACGRHLDASQFNVPASAMMLRCAHGKTFPACVPCVPSATTLIEEHDLSGQALQKAEAWH